MENGIKEKHKIKKEDILLGHIAKYYYHKGRRLNNDDILPVSRILPAMEEYANTKFLPAMKEKDGQLKELDKLYQYSLEQYRVELRRANELVIENAKQSEEIERMREEIVELKKVNSKLDFMVTNGLGPEDMVNDITYPKS